MTRKEYLKLVEDVRRCNDRYYNQDDPEVDDYTYDQMVRQLKNAEAEHPEWTAANSPTQNVGGSAVKTNRITHRKKLLSLNDVFSFGEVMTWYNNLPVMGEFSVQEKIDGLTAVMLYENGKLIHAATRGDGQIGELITENIKYVEGIPTELDMSKIPGAGPDNMLYVRAEVYMPVEAFERVNAEQAEQGKPLFANPRNCAAGSLRADPEITKTRGLHALAFAILDSSGFQLTQENLCPGRSETVDLSLLRHLGFAVVNDYRVSTDSGILNAIDAINASRSKLPYWIDGAVVKTDYKQHQNAIGDTNKYPKHAVAYKYPPENRNVKIKKIILQTGRTGVITPVAEFDPVILCGTSVTHATLHNQKFITDNKLGIGAEVSVIKSGEIIPKVVKTIRPADEIFKIARCPICGTDAVMGADENGNDTGVMMCPNEMCQGKTLRYITYFCSRDVMDIPSCGPSVIEKLYNAGFLTQPADLYSLHEHADEIAKLPGLGKTSVNKILSAIELSKQNDIDRVIKSLGIPGIGRHIGKVLAENYPSIDAIALLDKEVLAFHTGIGAIAAVVIYDYFHSDRISGYLALKAAGVNTVSKSYGKSLTGALTGKTFVITGTLPDMSREEAKAMIEKHGGKCSSSVSKKTDYLLAGENAGSKRQKALDLGVEIIDINQLKEML